MQIAVIIPAYKARKTILDVVARMPEEVHRIYVVDDACPQDTGGILADTKDTRVTLIRHAVNQGVGGAVKTGYCQAFADGADVAVKIDADGQMDPASLQNFIAPIRFRLADYTKGNRFFNPEDVAQMPFTRRFGNLGLSFLTKISSGYWNIFDPTNGYTALHRVAFNRLQLDKISQRYFFETDMLFRLNLVGAVVMDVPMKAFYADEESNLSSFKSLFEFGWKHAAVFAKRICYQYFLRDFNLGSINLVFGLPLLVFGGAFGTVSWWESIESLSPATAGTVMTAALPIIIGFQLLVGFFMIDNGSLPRIPLQKLVENSLEVLPKLNAPQQEAEA